MIERVEQARDTMRVLVGFESPSYTCRDVVAPTHVVTIPGPTGPVVILTPENAPAPLDSGDWLAPLPPGARGAYPTEAHFSRLPEVTDTAALRSLARRAAAQMPPATRRGEGQGLWAHLVVDEEGRVEPATIALKPRIADPDLRRTLTAGLARLRFRPVEVAGRPVRAWTTLKLQP